MFWCENIIPGEKFFGEDFKNKVLWINDILSEKDLEKLTLNNFPLHLNNEDEFIEKIKDIIQKKKKVIIVGDYDVDGIVATSIMILFLRKLNINYDYIIPNRFIHGYGLKIPLVKEIEKLNGDVIITVDNGIKSKEAITYAVSKNIEVIITDHHQVDTNCIPDSASLIINPHYENENLTFKDICGAVVTLFLCENYLVKEKNIDYNFIEEIRELSTLATITDVMPLYYGNRFLVKSFVEKIRKKELRNFGLNTLIERADIQIENFSSDDIGYLIGPILNATGRIETAEIGVKLLTSNKKDELIYLSQKCIDLNKLRKEITLNAMNEVVINESDNVLVIYQKQISEGIIGIIAGNISEKTQKPCFVFTKTSDNKIKGSGRSPDNYNILAGATRVLSNNEILFSNYGGHASAMGITLMSEENIEKFKNRINLDYKKNVTTTLNKICMKLEQGKDKFEDLFCQLDSLAPFGEGFKSPIFFMTVYPNFIKDLGKNGSSFIVIENDIKYYFSSFREKIEFGLQKIYFTISKTNFNGQTYYKGIIKEVVKINEE